MFEESWRDRLVFIPPMDRWVPEQCNCLKEWAWEVYQESREHMNKKIEGILLQIAKKLEKTEGWMVDKDWAVSLKADGYLTFVRTFMVRGSLDEDKWEDQIPVTIHLKLTSDDEWTYWPEFTVYAQVKLGDLKEDDIEYKMQSNVSFMSDDVKDEAKAAAAAKEITKFAGSHVEEVYQDYVEKNDELVRFYKQSKGEEGESHPINPNDD